ncbi:MAG: amidohydrolase family protein [Gammaproteobacteria bacterium]
MWFAHMVHPDQREIGKLAHRHTGVCHCPSSIMILASGIAPVREMLDAGVKDALSVDGSASNDGNHMLGEVRQAMLLQRVGWPGFRIPRRPPLRAGSVRGGNARRRVGAETRRHRQPGAGQGGGLRRLPGGRSEPR